MATKEIEITLRVKGVKMHLWLTSLDPEEVEVNEAQTLDGEDVTDSVNIEHVIEALYDWAENQIEDPTI
jgi:hypothetical protein